MRKDANAVYTINGYNIININQIENSMIAWSVGIDEISVNVQLLSSCGFALKINGR